jgi:hypothetical protein
VVTFELQMFQSWEISPWIRLWVGWRVDLNVVVKRKISAPAENENLVIQPIANHFTE